MEIRSTWNRVPKPAHQLIVFVVSSTLLVVGGLLLVLPGLFTLPFVFAGLFVLAIEFVWAERLLARSKEEIKKADPRKLFKKKLLRDNSRN